MNTRLVTNPRRVTLALACGLFGSPALVMLLISAAISLDNRNLEAFNLGAFLAVTAIGAVFMLPVMVVGVAPLWILLHRLRARYLTAAVAGGVLGTVVFGAFALLTGSQSQSDTPDQLLLILMYTGTGAIVGTVSGFGMWTIAYRPEPRPMETAEVFD